MGEDVVSGIQLNEINNHSRNFQKKGDQKYQAPDPDNIPRPKRSPSQHKSQDDHASTNGRSWPERMANLSRRCIVGLADLCYIRLLCPPSSGLLKTEIIIRIRFWDILYYSFDKEPFINGIGTYFGPL